MKRNTLMVMKVTKARELARRYNSLEEAAKDNGVTIDEMYRISTTVGATLDGYLFFSY